MGGDAQHHIPMLVFLDFLLLKIIAYYVVTHFRHSLTVLQMIFGKLLRICVNQSLFRRSCGHVDVSFGSHFNPVPTKGAK